MTGKFIVFEGIDGSGKSTTVHEIATRLKVLGFATEMFREPTEKTDASREIKRILKSAISVTPEIDAQLLELFLIDRLWDVRSQISPALTRGAVVLLDRYYLSTAAYQADTADRVREIMQSYLNDSRIPDPDLIIHLDLPVADALQRLVSRSERDVFETEARLTSIRGRYGYTFSEFTAARPHIPILKFQTALGTAEFEQITQKIRNLDAEPAS
jgi:dTMP kinase